MRFFNRNITSVVKEESTSQSTTCAGTPARQDAGRVPAIAVILGAVASIGGFMFGYESGQISGTSFSVLLPRVQRLTI
jgi:SP family sugar:H+ symporter-like MFS transporter